MGQELKLEEIWSSAEPMMSFRAVRHSVLMQATLSCGGGGGASARVRNISSGGMMAECRFRGAEGDRLRISMRGLGELTGRVAWSRNNRIGVTFDEEVDPTLVLRRRTPSTARTLRLVPPPPERAWRPALHHA